MLVPQKDESTKTSFLKTLEAPKEMMTSRAGAEKIQGDPGPYCGNRKLKIASKNEWRLKMVAAHLNVLNYSLNKVNFVV